MAEQQLQLADKIAADILASMSDSLKRHLASGSPYRRLLWTDVDGTIGTMKVLTNNTSVLMPIIQNIPNRVPGVYLLASVIMSFNDKLCGLYFNNLTKDQMAAECLREAGLIKSAIQYARKLTRNNPCSREPTLQAMKALFVFTSADEGPSPLTDAPETPPPTAPADAAAGAIVTADAPPAPARKKSRLGDSPAEPAFVRDTVEEAMAAVSGDRGTNPVQQWELSRERKSDRKLTDFPVVDPLRAVPPYFSEKVKDAFIRLPAVALPTSVSKGKLNFSLKDQNDTTIEVQLANKVFRCTRVRGHPWDQSSGSANVAWLQCESMTEAWDQIVKKAGGWNP